jgi:hypothetical protein
MLNNRSGLLSVFAHMWFGSTHFVAGGQMCATSLFDRPSK